MSTSVNPTVARVFLSVLFVAAIAAFVVASARSIAAAPVTGARVIPPPVIDVQAGNATSEIAVFAGGCFWGVQGIYQHVKGVRRAVSGYAGGERRTAVYERVSTGGTGHAESVQITFDPRLITYGRLLHIYFSVVHDPTQLNRQGPDVGTQYRSAIFPVNAAQADVARAYIAQLDQTRVFDAAIVTKIEPGHSFYPAEAHHQNFMARNPTDRYIVVHDLPKLENLRLLFPDVYRARPVLADPFSDL